MRRVGTIVSRAADKARRGRLGVPVVAGGAAEERVCADEGRAVYPGARLSAARDAKPSEARRARRRAMAEGRRASMRMSCNRMEAAGVYALGARAAPCPLPYLNG